MSVVPPKAKGGDTCDLAAFPWLRFLKEPERGGVKRGVLLIDRHARRTHPVAHRFKNLDEASDASSRDQVTKI
jgi:hypothetical protein